jgi:hypothetical protein
MEMLITGKVVTCTVFKILEQNKKNKKKRTKCYVEAFIIFIINSNVLKVVFKSPCKVISKVENISKLNCVFRSVYDD